MIDTFKRLDMILFLQELFAKKHFNPFTIAYEKK